MSITRLILIPSQASEPAPFMVVSTEGAVLQRGLLPLDPVERPPAMRTVAVAPGADVLIRWVDVPAGSELQVRAAVLWALRDQLAAAPDRLAVAVAGETPAEPRLAVVFDPALRQVWLDYCEALGLDIDVLLPDVLAVPEPVGEDEITAVAFHPNTALRGRRMAATVQTDLVELLAQGRVLSVLDQAEEVERLMVLAALKPMINLVERRRTSTTGWRRVAGLAAALALTPLLLTVVAAARDDLMAARMEDQTRRVVARAAPDLASAADPAEALERKLAAELPGGVSAVAAALYAAVESVEGAELDSFTADPEEGVRATVTYPAYEDLDSLKRSMRGAGLHLSDASTVDENGRIVSEVRIGAAT